VLFAVSAAVVSVPLGDFVPLQAPDALHAVAFRELQVSTEVPPDATETGLLSSVTVGTTFTVTEAGLLVPPAPLQVKENVVLLVSAPVLTEPLGAWAPLHPPEPVQVVALLELQVNIALPPAATATTDAPRVAVGGTDVALSPPPHAASNSSAAAVNQ
jgi:hypothetical protein